MLSVMIRRYGIFPRIISGEVAAMLVQYATSIFCFKSKSRSASLGIPAKREHHIDPLKDTKLRSPNPSPLITITLPILSISLGTNNISALPIISFTVTKLKNSG
jgi:hypothetical protein